MRWYESNGDAPEARDREHTRDSSTVFDNWYDGTNATMEVVASKQFYVRYNLVTRDRYEEDMEKMKAFRKLMEQSYVTRYRTLVSHNNGGKNTVNPDRYQMKVDVFDVQPDFIVPENTILRNGVINGVVFV